ncbi:unnamed protein product, partial [Effrenium voratum]
LASLQKWLAFLLFSAMDLEKPRQPATLELLLGNKSSDSGVTELVGVGLLWFSGSWVLLQKGAAFGALFAHQVAGSPKWRPLALKYPVLVLLHCLVVDLSAWLQRRLARKWRQNITRKLHRMYFEKQNFYRLQAEPREAVILDADVRICRDVHEMAHATAEVAVAVMEALMKTLVFGASTLFQRNGAVRLWGLCPPAVFLVAVKVVLGTHPSDGKTVQTSLQHFEGRLKQHFLRLQTRARSILMIQGEPFELDLLQKALRDMATMARKLYDVMFGLEMTEWMILHTTQAASLLELAAFTSAALLGMRSISEPAGPQEARVLGQQLRRVQDFFSVCSGWSAFLSSRTLLMASAAATGRVKQLYVRLECLDTPSAKARPRRKSKDPAPELYVEGETLTFRSVTLHTPAKQALLRDLTFSVEKGPLLVCGHALSGKSVLAKALFGLWPLVGQITRPGASHTAEGIPLPEDILYMPERPLLGLVASLSDEVTFPRPLPEGLPPEELQRWLAYVGLDHLTEEGLLSLSLRDQQSLGFARLLFHRPRFAVLDGCTSAMGVELERRFLRLARELGVCCITMTRRASQSLKDQHARMLVLHSARGEDTRGWKLFELGEVAVKARCRCSAEAFQRLDALEALEVSEEPASSSSGPARSELPELPALRWQQGARIWAMLQLGLLTSGRRRMILQKVGLMLLLLHARTNLYWRFCQSLAGILHSLVARDLAQLARRGFLAALLSLGGGFADQALRYQAKLATVELWSGAVAHLQRKMLRDREPLLRPEVEPMRLAEVRGLFEGLGSTACEALLALAQLAFVAPALVRRLGRWAGIFVLQFAALRLLQLGPERSGAKAAQAEAAFQAQHTRLRSRAEVFALCCRGVTERQNLEDHFEALMSSSEGSVLPQLALTLLGDFREMPSLAVRVLSARLAGVVSASEIFLFDRMLQVTFIAVQQLVKCAEKAARLDAQCLRCLELVVAVEATSKRSTSMSPQTTEEAPAAGDSLHFSEKELVTEDGVVLARRLQFEMVASEPLLICGPSGFAKPLLSRLLLGEALDRAKGIIARPPRQTMLLCAQEPYVPGYCRLLALLACPLLLRLPSHPPFTVHVAALPESVTEPLLRQHFAALNAASCQVVVERGCRKGLVYFSTFEEIIKAVARPQDRVIGDTELQCEIAAPGAASPAGEALPRLVRMRKCLRAVDLDHVLTREQDGWFARRSWPELLTREEQQRLCLARVLYHQPTFCILEEATCTLAPQQEARIMELLLAWHVTPLALSSAPEDGTIFRRQLHLGLAQGDGWKLVDLTAT